MNALSAVLYRESKIRATNVTFIFFDLFYPLCYMMIFGVGINAALGAPVAAPGVDYNAFFLAGVLGMASFGIASNTAWTFFMDRDNGIFYEMLTYPMSRSEYLFGKVLFNLFVTLVQSVLTVGIAGAALHVPLRADLVPLLFLAVAGGTVGWFFFYSIFALSIRRNDTFNAVTSIFYFVFFVREFNVLSAGAAAAVVARGRDGEPHHLAGGRAALRLDRCGLARSHRG